MRIYKRFKIPENLTEAKKLSIVGSAMLPYITISTPTGFPLRTEISFESVHNMSEEEFRTKMFEVGSKIVDEYIKQYI